MALCDICKSLPLDKLSSMNPVSLPKYGQLAKNSVEGCEGCRFFCDTLHLHIEQSDNPSWQPDHEMTVSLSPLWRRGWCVDLEFSDRRTNTHSSTRIFQRDKSMFEPDFPVPRDPLDDSSWRKIRTWMKGCVEHGCEAHLEVGLPKRVVEVSPSQAPRIVENIPTMGQYIALSHCWGIKKMTKLLLENEQGWKSGIEVLSLSRNFRDAIKITQLLGFKYIWIDALCIIQNSATDWVEEAPKMAEIYRNAALVISATSATNSEQGILNHRRCLCSPVLGTGRFYVSEKHMYKGSPYGYERESPLCVLNNLPLNKRGWAAQERIMATRILHYTEFELVWECAKGCCSESSYPWSPKSDEKLNSSDQPQLLFHKDRLQGIFSDRQSQGDRELKGADLRDGNSTGVLISWFDCVQEFSHRDLTYPSDKLPAIAGLAVALSDSLGPYVAGLWRESIMRCLAWEVAATECRKAPAQYRSPSWSWAAVDGKIVHSWESVPEGDYKPQYSNPSGWPDKYNPRMVDIHVIHKDISNPYMTPLEGCFIVLEGNCTSAEILEGALDDSKDRFRSNVRADTLDNWAVLRRKSELLCMQLQWRVASDKTLDTLFELHVLLLIATDARLAAFKRLGIAIITVGRSIGYVDGVFRTPMTVKETFESFGWQRRLLKII